MRMLTDNPIQEREDDKFGFHTYANILAHTIRDTEKLPFSIGIFGAWGTGKTSLMKMIEAYAKEEQSADAQGKKVKSIWFNPWKYDKKEDLWHALIQSILYRIAEEGDRKLEKKAKELAAHTAWFFIKKGITAATHGFISAEYLENVKNAMIKKDEIHYRHINHFEEDFKEVIDLYTNHGKLIVFIDDLDRCLPENAITVLESLKLFIGSSRCVFVLGMDHYIVEEGIKHRYGEKIKLSGRDYLDKIIQVPFFLPPVPFNKLRSMLEETNIAQYTEAVWSLLDIGLGGNPRHTKRFVNCYYLLNQVINESSSEMTEEIDKIRQIEHIPQEHYSFYMAKLLIIQMKYQEFYTKLKLDSAAWADYEVHVLPPEGRDEFLSKRKDLVPFWEDEYLRSFMIRTSNAINSKFPPKPSAIVVGSLIKMISLVSPDETYQQSERSFDQRAK
ncbi:MAG: hypothetical protein JSV33_10655 [bacterium]|nr:MAG: hypothetical protein JSV33_10655 [bacterium]